MSSLLRHIGGSGRRQPLHICDLCGRVADASFLFCAQVHSPSITTRAWIYCSRSTLCTAYRWNSGCLYLFCRRLGRACFARTRLYSRSSSFQLSVFSQLVFPTLIACTQRHTPTFAYLRTASKSLGYIDSLAAQRRLPTNLLPGLTHTPSQAGSDYSSCFIQIFVFCHGHTQ